MNKKLKVVTVVGTRPEIIRLSRVIDRLDQADVIEHILIHTGQNYDYELNQIFFEDLNEPLTQTLFYTKQDLTKKYYLIQKS
jgi:UDP-N-acetylglucosamine 2-epimerase